MLVVKPEVAADGERLGLMFDLGLELDLGRTLLLELDPLRAWWIYACFFTLPAVVFHLAVRARGARCAPHLLLPVGAPSALRAVAFHLAVRTRVALRALVFQLPVRAVAAVHAAVFYLAVGTRVALLALV